MPRATHVESRPNHRLLIVFDDGLTGELDLSARLFGPMFAPLQDPALFAQVELDDFGAPCWPNGADLAPDALYAQVQAAHASFG